MREQIARIVAPFMEGGREFDFCPPDRIALRKWSRAGLSGCNDATQSDALELADAILPLMEKVAQAAIEASAEVCAKQRNDFLSPQYAVNQPISSIMERFACDECGNAIRALSPKSIVEGVK